MKHVQIRIAPDLMTKINRLREQQPVKPSVSDTVRVLIERGLATMEQGKKGGST